MYDSLYNYNHTYKDHPADTALAILTSGCLLAVIGGFVWMVYQLIK